MTSTAVVVQPKQIERLLIEKLPELETYLVGSEVTPERFVKAAKNAIFRYPDIGKAPVAQVLDAILQVAEMGLEPTGSYGGAHLIRYGDKVNVLVDYRGFVKMALRSGQVRSVSADVVYAGDDFRYERGSSPRIIHEPTLNDAKRGDVTHVYAIARLSAGGEEFVVMTKAEVEVIRRRTRSKDSGPWMTDWAEMAKKTAVRRLFKLIPVAITPQLATALEREDSAESMELAPPVEMSRRSLLARLGVSGPESPETPAEEEDDRSVDPVASETVDDGLPEMKS